MVTVFAVVVAAALAPVVATSIAIAMAVALTAVGSRRQGTLNGEVSMYC